MANLLRDFSDWTFERDEVTLTDRVGANIFEGLKYIGTSIWDWFVPLLPDLIGYGAVATGAFVILSTMFGQGAIKPLAVFSGVTILAVCILEAN